MARPEEIAEITVNGQIYRDWTNVEVSRDANHGATTFSLGIAEASSSPGGWAALKLKPQDQCIIKLAGKKVITGFIDIRQAAYSSRQHGVTVVGRSKGGDTVDSSVVAKSGEFKGYGYEQVIQSVLKPFGIKLKLEAQPESGKFSRVDIQFGERVFDLIARLTRMANLHLVDDNDGNLVAFRAKRESIFGLEEGRNIKQASCVIRSDFLHTPTVAVQQQTGNDKVWGEEARNSSASVENKAINRYRPDIFLAEQPGDREALKARVKREVDEQIGSQIDCTVVVQGWLMDDSTLWLDRVGRGVIVKSPMLFPGKNGAQILAIKGVSCTQDSEGGTLTTLKLCDPGHLGAPQVDVLPDQDTGDLTKPNPSPAGYPA